MRRILSIAIVALMLGGVLLARGGMQAPGGQQSEGEKKLIDLKSDLMGPVAAGDSVIFLVGNFAAQHNGAVITCDSAVRYSDMRIEFFGNVLINKNTTYIYGDRAEYDGEINQARIYSDLVKVVDGDAVLYTYTFFFDTKDNIGRFADGGVLINRENRMEAVRGYYYADTKELIGVGAVEMRNDEYELRGDSVVYNMATDNASFYDRTNIWSRDGDYLYADRGYYDKNDTLYVVTRNGYVLTAEQEMWSDSIDFYRAREHVILHRDIQLDDTGHKLLAFGDYGEYWKEPGNVLLTRRPAVVSYDLSQGDSLFMRSDTIYLYTVFPQRGDRTPEDVPAAGSESGDDAPQEQLPADGRELSDGRPLRRPTQGQLSDSTGMPAAFDLDSLAVRPVRVDSLAAHLPAADSLAADSLAGVRADSVQLTPAERKAAWKEEQQRLKREQKAARAKARSEELERIAAQRQERTTAKLLAQKEREERQLAARRLKAESKLRARQQRAARKGKPIPTDSSALQQIDSLLERNAAMQDSLLRLLADEWVADSVEIVSQQQPEAQQQPDTMYRLLKGYRNVRIYRSDFQAVCDSMTAISTDSTIHLYIDPVLWNQSNQITSDEMDIYTAFRQLTRAEFIGSPMMVAELDTVHYNQVAGKQMVAYFYDNEIRRNDVNGNAQTIYYMQDGEPPEVTGVGFIESGEISFYVEEKQVVQITYRGDPVFDIYPMDKIPPDKELYLKGFKWEGARRPAQADVLDRWIRPSQRAAKSQLPHPDFPILQRIEADKARLIEERRWIDRMDEVDAATAEWMRTLGFEVGQPRREMSGSQPFAAERSE